MSEFLPYMVPDTVWRVSHRSPTSNMPYAVALVAFGPKSGDKMKTFQAISARIDGVDLLVGQEEVEWSRLAPPASQTPFDFLIEVAATQLRGEPFNWFEGEATAKGGSVKFPAEALRHVERPHELGATLKASEAADGGTWLVFSSAGPDFTLVAAFASEGEKRGRRPDGKTKRPSTDHGLLVHDGAPRPTYPKASTRYRLIRLTTAVADPREFEAFVDCLPLGCVSAPAGKLELTCLNETTVTYEHEEVTA